MDIEKLKEEIKSILEGIDETDTQSECGWWETSIGAKFGKDKLNEVLELIKKEHERCTI